MSIATVEISVPGSVPSSVEIEGGFGPDVVEINQGPAGPNSVTTSTSTTITGILKGTGSTVLAATAGTDYLAPTGNGSGLTGLVSAQITDATPDPTPDKIVIRGGGGEASFGDPNAGTSTGLISYGFQGDALYAVSASGQGAYGKSESSNGVRAESASGNALSAVSDNSNHADFGNGKFIIANNGDTTLTGSISASNLSGTNTGDQDLSGLAPKPEAKSSNFTAANGASYVSTATLTVTDPSPAEGQGFSVLVRNGTATIGGTAFATAGTVIRRVFHSGAWQNYIYLNSAQLSTLATTTPGTGVATALGNAVNTTGGVVTVDGAATLTNKTLTSPSINAITTTGSLTLSGAGTSGLFGLRSTSTTGYSSMELLGSGGSQMGGFGYANASAGAYADQVYFYSAGKALILATTAGARNFYMAPSGGVSIGTTTDAGATNLLVAGRIVSGGVVRLKGYTFATLPAGTQGDKAFITDGAALPIFRANAAGGGSTVTEVFYNGTAWINS